MRSLPDAVEATILRAPGRVVHHSGLVSVGLTARTIQRWTQEGRLESPIRGWYRLPGAQPLFQNCWLAVGHLRHRFIESRISSDAALSLLGVDHDLLEPDPPLLLVPHGVRTRGTGGHFITAQRRGLHEIEEVTCRGLPIAPVAMALADLADPTKCRPLSDSELRSLLYTTINQLRTSPAELADAWSGMVHPGAHRLRGLAELGVLEHESPGEWDLFRTVFQRYPPAPDCQVWLSPSIRVDFAYLFSGLVLEYLGEEAHANRVDEDASRTYALRQLGCEVIAITKSMLRAKRALALHVHQTRRRREHLILKGELARPAVPAQPRRLTPLRTLNPLF